MTCELRCMSNWTIVCVMKNKERPLNEFGSKKIENEQEKNKIILTNYVSVVRKVVYDLHYRVYSLYLMVSGPCKLWEP